MDEYYELSEAQQDKLDQDSFFDEECEGMTVGELIEKLKALDPTLPVRIGVIGYDGWTPSAETWSFKGGIESVRTWHGDGVLIQGRDYSNYHEPWECDGSGCGHCGESCSYKDGESG
jgi:hypothetical protein